MKGWLDLILLPLLALAISGFIVEAVKDRINKFKIEEKKAG